MPTQAELLVQWNRSDSLWQVRVGRGRHAWRNDFVAGTTVPTVITGARAIVNIPEGYRFMATQMNYSLESLNDHAHFELGSCSLANGGGVFTPMTGHRHMATGNARNPYGTQHSEFAPPMRFRYQDGCRSIAIRVTCNDNTAEVTAGFCGWIELDD